MPLISVAHVGPMAHTARDVLLTYAAIAGTALFVLPLLCCVAFSVFSLCPSLTRVAPLVHSPVLHVQGAELGSCYFKRMLLILCLRSLAGSDVADKNSLFQPSGVLQAPRAEG